MSFLLYQLEMTGRAADAPLQPTTAMDLAEASIAASSFFNTRLLMSADYVAARCAELLAVCGESLEPLTPVPPGGVSQKRQMQRLRQALLCQEPAKVRLVVWVHRKIDLWHVMWRLAGLVYTTDEAIASLNRMKDNTLETENKRDIAQKLLAFMDAWKLYEERYRHEFSRKFYDYEKMEMSALVRKLDWEWMQFK